MVLSVQVLGLNDLCRLTPHRRLYPLRVPRSSALSTASFGFSVTQDTLAAQLTLPLVGRVEDFHLQGHLATNERLLHKPTVADDNRLAR